MSDGYQPVELVQKYYPTVKIQRHPNSLSGLRALVTNDADVLLGSALSVQYLINQNFLKQLKMSNLSQLETPSFSFGIHKENDWLLRAFNAALSAIPHEIKHATLRRWSGGMMLADKKLMLTQAEQQ